MTNDFMPEESDLQVRVVVPRPGRKAHKLDLYANGIDFVREGLERLYDSVGEPDVVDRKYALLHIFSGVLLVLKARLRKEHELLIRAKVDSNGDAARQTVSFDQLMGRLRACGVTFDPTHLQQLRDAQSLRNEIEHYEVDLTTIDVDSVVGGIAELVEHFVHEHFDDDLLQHLNSRTAERVGELQKVAHRRRELAREQWLERARRYFDLTEEQIEEIRGDVEYHAKHNPNPTKYFECPQCWADTAVAVEPDIAVCLNSECQDVFAIDECPRCGNPVPESGSPFCDGCTGSF